MLWRTDFSGLGLDYDWLVKVRFARKTERIKFTCQHFGLTFSRIMIFFQTPVLPTCRLTPTTSSTLLARPLSWPPSTFSRPTTKAGSPERASKRTGACTTRTSELPSSTLTSPVTVKILAENNAQMKRAKNKIVKRGILPFFKSAQLQVAWGVKGIAANW